MSPANHVVTSSWLSAWPGKMQPFKDHPSCRGHPRGLKNKPRHKQTAEPLAVVHNCIVRLCIRPCKRCACLCLCAHNNSFGKSGRICTHHSNTLMCYHLKLGGAYVNYCKSTTIVINIQCHHKEFT